MDPRLGRSAFTINFSNPNAFVKKFPVIPPANQPTACSSQLDVLAQCSSYNLSRGSKREFDGLSQGLGNSSSSDSSKQSMGTGCTVSSAKGSDDGSSIDLDFNYVTLGNEGTSRLDKQACDSRRALPKAGLDLELPLSVGPSHAVIIGADFTAATTHNNTYLQPYIMDSVPRVDEEVTSARRPSGSQLLSFLKKAKMSGFSPKQMFSGSSNQTQGSVPMPTLLQLRKSPAACTSGFVRPLQRSSSTKICSYPGCVKEARGSSGCCIALLSFFKNAKMCWFSPKQVFPGSSNQTQGSVPMPTLLQLPKSPAACTSGFVRPQQRSSSTKICSYPGCVKGARGSSGCCIAHGGGRRCQKEGCGKGAEGKTIFCKAHGGGRRCEHLGCTKSAEGSTDLCIAHGGGRRCSHEECKRAARGKSGRCIKHGGGKRCQHENCAKSAYGRSGLCIAHGSWRCCQHVGCGKGAQGGTNFCRAHGGGKRCTHPNCTKGAEGSTPFCKGHGGGKRCSAEGCTKSLHGGTQFCACHGGGKRCVVEGCTKSARGRTDCCVGHGGGKRCKSAGCDKSAQGSTDFCKAHGGGKRCLWGHQGSDLGVGGPPCERLARGKKGLCVQHNPVLDDNGVHGGRTLGAFSILGNALAHGDGPSNTETSRHGILVHPVEAPHRVPLPTPEGRVHGGHILSMFLKSTNSAEASTSAPRNWKSTNDIQASTSSRRNWL